MNKLKLIAQRRLYKYICFLKRKLQKPIWKNRSKAYLTIFYDYEGKYALPDKVEASFQGVNQILETARAYGIRTTFFTVGRLFFDYPEIIRRMIYDGHDIASHTFNHCNIREISEKEILKDILLTRGIFDKFGLDLKGIRCPQNKWSFKLLKIMALNGLCWSAETDKSPYPYIIYKNNHKQIVRFPITIMDYNYKCYDPERMYLQLIADVNRIQSNKSYGAIGFHPWLIGENNLNQVLNDFYAYLSKLQNLEIVTFNEAYDLISSKENLLSLG